MEAVGGEVVAVLAIPLLALAVLIITYWQRINTFLMNQFRNDIRIEETDSERERREILLNDLICSICLTEPKQLQASSTCGHSFCAQCILALYRHDDEQQIKCPLCRKDINLLFRIFASTDATLLVERRMKEYNRRFDDNRPLLRRIQQFPYVLKRLWRHFLSIRFLVFFLRRLQVVRWLFIVIFYLILPFDILPEQFLGIIGFIDDFLFFLFLLVFLMTLAAIQYHRHHHQ